MVLVVIQISLQLRVRVVYLQQFHSKFINVAHLLLVHSPVIVYLMLAALRFGLCLFDLVLTVSALAPNLLRYFNLFAKLSLQVLELVQQRNLVLFALIILLTDLIEVVNESRNDEHAFVQFGLTGKLVLILVLFELAVSLSQVVQLVSKVLIVLLIMSESLHLLLQVCDQLVFMRSFSVLWLSKHQLVFLIN